VCTGVELSAPVELVSTFSVVDVLCVGVVWTLVVVDIELELVEVEEDVGVEVISVLDGDVLSVRDVVESDDDEVEVVVGRVEVVDVELLVDVLQMRN
jgi:hypothetical protein